mgnify:CR=1 FL=1
MINLRNKKIIVTFLMHLGDLILITPFLQVLRRHAQGSEITLVVDEKVADVVRYNPNIDHLVTVDKKGKDNSVRALWRIGRHLHQHHYDILINLHPNERTSFLAAVIHAKQFVGMSHFLVRPLMDRYTRLDRIHLHAADMYINVLAQLGIDDYRSDGLQFFTCKAWDDKATEFYRTQGVHNSDEAMVKEATSQMESDPIIATGKFTIGELASAIRCCSLFITNDSGPMHVAVSQGVPLVALYGPSNPKLYGPYTDRAIVLESTNHYEVGKSMKQIIREGNYKGISVIPMSQVIAAGEELLSRYYGRK